MEPYLLRRVISLATDRLGRINHKFKLEDNDEASRQIAKRLSTLLLKMNHDKKVANH
jgi:hypothetical protein